MSSVLCDPEVLIENCEAAVKAATALVHKAKQAVTARVFLDDRLNKEKLEHEQYAAHGFAWYATYAETLKETLGWMKDIHEAGKFGDLEQALVCVGFGDYLAQMAGGICMSQCEIVHLTDMYLDAADGSVFEAIPQVATLIQEGNTDANRKRIVELIDADSGSFGQLGLDETHTLIRDQFRRFADAFADDAHQWHLNNDFIPLELIKEMADMGVFGLTVPEEYGGSGIGKLAMCLVSEELCRGYIGVGSLATRCEIAGELLLVGGTEEQKNKFFPGLIAGEIIPTAVFTEPNTGSDLGALRTRAVKEGDLYKIYGNKTWITHAARADLMTLMVRTNPDTTDHRGLSMLLAEKPRGDDENPFRAEGMTGGEIEVLGYRGMKEYEIGFDGFEVKAQNLLGLEEGQGFKQLMVTFESARIQTAARAIGVGQSALEQGLAYARERQQFGKALINFPRVYAKIALGAAELMMARQLTYFSARRKDSGHRCDLEAGMAKLLGARAAWSAADNALQIHGGNGYALEYKISRILCDARILSIFEGAAEIQANVIASRLLEI